MNPFHAGQKVVCVDTGIRPISEAGFGFGYAAGGRFLTKDKVYVIHAVLSEYVSLEGVLVNDSTWKMGTMFYH